MERRGDHLLGEVGAHGVLEEVLLGLPRLLAAEHQVGRRAAATPTQHSTAQHSTAEQSECQVSLHACRSEVRQAAGSQSDTGVIHREQHSTADQ
jgi:hypothetical protein